jgi:hypothetical protein
MAVPAKLCLHVYALRTCHMPYPSHALRLTPLLIFSEDYKSWHCSLRHYPPPPRPTNFVSLRFKYFPPQHPVLDLPQPLFFPQRQRSSMSPTYISRTSYTVHILIFSFLYTIGKKKHSGPKQQQVFVEFSPLSVSSCMQFFLFLNAVHKFADFAWLDSATVSMKCRGGRVLVWHDN